MAELADARLGGDARGRDGGVREELAAGIGIKIARVRITEAGQWTRKDAASERAQSWRHVWKIRQHDTITW